MTVEQDRFAGTVVATDPNSDYWHWEAFIGGSDLSWSTRRFTVGLPHVAGDGTIKVFLKGAAVGVHVVRVSVNGHVLGEASWQDLQDFELRLPVTAAQLQSGGNSVEVRALGGDDDMFYLDRIEMEYRRTARAVDDRLTLTAESDGPIAADGFGASDIRVFDIGDPKRPVLVTATSVGPGAVGQSVSFNAQQGRRYLALAGAAIGRAAFQPMTAADLQYSRDRVDYLVIAAPELRDAAQALADYREARGLASRVVGTDEIYDSFSWGMATPEALRDFLRFATRSWGVRFVVLAGPGTFDYRDLGDRLEPQVPTLMTSTPSGLFACDSCLVDFDGDGAPDVPISRIPASTAADIQRRSRQGERIREECRPAAAGEAPVAGRQVGPCRRLLLARQRLRGAAAAVRHDHDTGLPRREPRGRCAGGTVRGDERERELGQLHRSWRGRPLRRLGGAVDRQRPGCLEKARRTVACGQRPDLRREPVRGPGLCGSRRAAAPPRRRRGRCRLGRHQPVVERPGRPARPGPLLRGVQAAGADARRGRSASPS